MFLKLGGCDLDLFFWYVGIGNLPSSSGKNAD